ncbi:hypothetical protein OIE50_28030 [Streptomyces canus]|uniref:hypothetical protein n=1 Tax=Streptomyces canus TaxID=58343 RepID=UPI00324B25A9
MAGNIQGSQTGGTHSGTDSGKSHKSATIFSLIIAPILVALIVWLITDGPFKDPSATGGSIESVTLSNGRPCCTFNVKASIKGYDDQTCTSRAIIIDTANDNQGSPFDVGYYRSETDQDEGAIDIYIPINTAGSYKVRFILYAPNGTEIDRKDSEPIKVTSP